METLGVHYNCEQYDYKASKQRFTNLENMRESKLAVTKMISKELKILLWECNHNMKESAIYQTLPLVSKGSIFDQIWSFL